MDDECRWEHEESNDFLLGKCRLNAFDAHNTSVHLALARAGLIAVSKRTELGKPVASN